MKTAAMSRIVRVLGRTKAYFMECKVKFVGVDSVPRYMLVHAPSIPNEAALRVQHYE